jgi:hypothetical protein
MLQVLATPANELVMAPTFIAVSSAQMTLSSPVDQAPSRCRQSVVRRDRLVTMNAVKKIEIICMPWMFRLRLKRVNFTFLLHKYYKNSSNAFSGCRDWVVRDFYLVLAYEQATVKAAL